MTTTTDLTARRCPRCGAAVGQPCVTALGLVMATLVHEARKPRTLTQPTKETTSP